LGELSIVPPSVVVNKLIRRKIMMILTVDYAIRRMERYDSTIEFIGGYCNLSNEEKEEYQRLRAYLSSYRALKQLGLDEESARKQAANM
jgi:hypothetical protein